MRARSQMCLVCVAVMCVLTAGCGDTASRADDQSSTQVNHAGGQPDGGMEFNQRLVKEQVRQTAHKLRNPDEACFYLDAHFLAENYGSGGAAGLQTCKEKTAGRQSVQIRSIDFVKVTPNAAAAILTDARGVRVLLRFRLSEGKWLLHSAESPEAAKGV